MTPKEVFLSHSSNNSPVATLIAETLRNHGIPTWFSPTNILSAQQWHDEIGKALKRCDWFLILLSNDAIVSRWVRWELLYAINHNQYDNHIMPIIIENCEYEELSWILGNFQMVNFIADRDEAFRQILRTWGLGFDRNLIA